MSDVTVLRVVCALLLLVLLASGLACVHSIRRGWPGDPFAAAGRAVQRFAPSTARLERAKRRVCSNELTYCFEDGDCTARCDAANRYRCTNGVCRNERIISRNPKNECDVRRGFVAYLTGDTAFATYRYECKSVDPGVAVAVDENLMCKGSAKPIEIDYVKRYPSTYECDCAHKALVPATSVKRAHVECSDRYYDLIAFGYH